MHDIALVDEPDAGRSREGRGDPGIVELGLREIDGALIGLDLRLELGDRGALGIECLQGDIAARCQIGEAFQVDVRVDQIRLVFQLARDGLIVIGLEGAGVDLRQEVARLDLLPLGEGNPLQLAVDLGPDDHGIIGLHRAQARQVERHVAVLHGRDLDGHRRRRYRQDGSPGALPEIGLDRDIARQGGGKGEGSGDEKPARAPMKGRCHLEPRCLASGLTPAPSRNGSRRSVLVSCRWPTGRLPFFRSCRAFARLASERPVTQKQCRGNIARGGAAGVPREAWL